MERNGLKQILLCQSSFHAPTITCRVRDVHFMFSNKNYCCIRFHGNGLYNSLRNGTFAPAICGFYHSGAEQDCSGTVAKAESVDVPPLLLSGKACAVLVLASVPVCRKKLLSVRNTITLISQAVLGPFITHRAVGTARRVTG